MTDDVGGRIHRLRVERGLSQVELATQLQISGSYLSLIESGRRPPKPAMLETIAARLGCSVDYLQTGQGLSADDSAELDLRFAEMALRNGETQVAEERFADVLQQAEERGWHDLRMDARWGLARTREARGHLEAAIDGYEALVSEPNLPGTLTRVRIETALCRAYSECGDLDRAIEVGEAGLSGRLHSEHQTDLSGEGAVALVSTLVGCYYERGDLVRAHSLAQIALSRASERNLPLARAAALWNAGLVAEARGDLRTARRFVDQALALYSESENVRAVALMKIASAWLLLREPDPQLFDAERLLVSALTDLPIVGGQVDIAYGETELARCRLLDGDLEGAIRLAEASLERLGAHPRLERARARLVLGHAKLESGDAAGAVQAYAAAATELRQSGARRQAASAWRELAESLVQLGRRDEALDAYREASDAAGVSRAPDQIVRSRTAARRA